MNHNDYHNENTGFHINHYGQVIEFSGIVKNVRDAQATIQVLQRFIVNKQVEEMAEDSSE